MADRLFSAALLLVALGYTWIAFSAIGARIQYDPLGPESWPRILGVLVSVFLVVRLIWPRAAALELPRGTLARLATALALLLAYALLFQPLGFVLATLLFCTAITVLLGGRPTTALIFGASAGIAVYILCVLLLDLNLPAGLLAFLE